MHPTTGIFTRLLGFAPDYWAFHPTTGLCTRRLGFAPDYWTSPDYWALYPTPTTGLSSEYRVFDPNPKSPHSSDQRTFMGHFPLNPGPLLMAYSHIYVNLGEAKQEKCTMQYAVPHTAVISNTLIVNKLGRPRSKTAGGRGPRSTVDRDKRGPRSAVDRDRRGPRSND